MTDNLEYRKYLDERFARLFDLINLNHKESMDSNDRIETHVERTNGRVLDLEKKVVSLEITDKLHIAECPAMPMIKDLKTEVDNFRVEKFINWLRSNPKTTIGILIVILYAAYNIFSYFSVEQIVTWIK